MIIGIDLGTTNSLVAVWSEGEAKIIPNQFGSATTPSVVGVGDDGDILVGLPARQRLVSHPHLTVANFKRHMGTTKEYVLGQRTYKPEELSSLVLRSLKEQAEAQLQEAVTEAVVTVPAYFNDTQRKATKIAGQLAGLKVDRLLNEPTAAALAYGLHQRESESKFLILDLGGGTFDVSVLELFDGVMEVHASAGDNYLGGEDFTQLIGDYFIRQILEHVETDRELTPTVKQLVHNQAEKCKRSISTKNNAVGSVVIDGRAIQVSISGERFENLCEQLLQRIKQPVQRALRDAKLLSADINDVVLVGGASRMPLVRQLVTRLFGRFPKTTLNPDEAIALGAAVQAGLVVRDNGLDDIVLTDVSPYTLGVEVAESVTENSILPGQFLPIIERNSYVPVSRSTVVSTLYDDQSELNVKVYQGESPVVKDNIFLGSLSINVTPKRAGEECIDIRFTYDINGILEVEVTTLSTGEVAKKVIEENPGVLTEEEIVQRFKSLQMLKIHPRDKAENTLVITRADRLYQESLGEARKRIGRALIQFKALLEQQEDERKIRKYRIALDNMLDDLDKSVIDD